ncbi:hypothetical protein [Crocosphaera sp.]|uniref:hypothetical protein n=1 Tax=Crocosphaera sp. TaxID=2729996 RepID=UPI003F286504|nr:hypothetical protein [Crocosphaera sp.]
MDQREFYLSVYQDYREHARHSESIRETINTLLLAIAAAIATVMTDNARGNGGIGPEDRYLAIILFVVGILGLASFIGYTDRYYRNKMRAYYLRNRLSDSLVNNHNLGVNIEELINQADNEYYKEYRKHPIFNTIIGFDFDENERIKKRSFVKLLHHFVSLMFPLILTFISFGLMIVTWFFPGLL